MLKIQTCPSSHPICRKSRKYRKSRGFTLLEILIVLAIIGVMAAALIPKIESAMNKSSDTQIVMNLTTLDSGARLYEMEHGESPKSIDDLKGGKYVPDKSYAGITLGEPKDGHCTFTGKLSTGETVSSDALGKTAAVKQSGE